MLKMHWVERVNEIDKNPLEKKLFKIILFSVSSGEILNIVRNAWVIIKRKKEYKNKVSIIREIFLGGYHTKFIRD